MADLRRSTEVRQVELTDAALHIIATRGIAALTTRSLAEQVGLSSGAIFRHFASIDALIEAVVARVELVMESTFPSSELPPRERLDRFVEARSTAVGGQVGIMQLMLSEQFLLALPEGGSARLAACAQKTREFVRACLREGQTAGEFRSDIDAGALVVVVMGTIQMLALSAANRRQIGTAPQSVRDALGVLLRPPPPVVPQSTRAKGSRGR
ncbi:MAG: TetR/AcrR family transcriptional regulator [Deltaproteobacteria bacterium]|nr:TetR/AcrR family transcriptional regulator [Deltaproteobacteria bacterium]